MYVAAIQYGCFDALSIERQKGIIAQQTGVLAFANYQWLCENPGTPRLYQVAPKYAFKRRPFNLDAWSDLVTVYGQRSGDCKDFVAIRCAELWRDGYTQAQPFVSYSLMTDATGRQAIGAFHVVVACGPEIEDPSRLLGMPEKVSFSLLRRLFD